jgi:hypothetical protein
MPANPSRRSAADPCDPVAAVRAVYDALAHRAIERACVRSSNCCRFQLTGKTPYLTKGEALVAARAYRATGRTTLPDPPDGSCPMLDAAGRCVIYNDRPFACRTHFCAAAGGPYARRDVLDLIRILEEIDHTLGGSGPIPIQRAIEASCESLAQKPRPRPTRAI